MRRIDVTRTIEKIDSDESMPIKTVAKIIAKALGYSERSMENRIRAKRKGFSSSDAQRASETGVSIREMLEKRALKAGYMSADNYVAIRRAITEKDNSDNSTKPQRDFEKSLDLIPKDKLDKIVHQVYKGNHYYSGAAHQFSQMIRGIPEEEQDILKMRVIEQQTWEQIGKKYGFSRESARKRFDKLRARLREDYELIED